MTHRQKRRLHNRRIRKEYNKLHPKWRRYTLYALRLENDNYYIGMTSYKDVNIRFNQHVNGDGAKWTKLHKPIEVIETRDIGYITEGDCTSLESQMTVEYANKYGIEHVRGGSMCFLSVERCRFALNKYASVL